jgi:hypothetical protein
MNAKHSKESVRWGTPSFLVEKARTVMGSIDLDPCTELKFEPIIKAKKSYSLLDRGEDGLELPWEGNVFLNPPGGVVKEFWEKACKHSGAVFWVGFSVEQLCTLTDYAYGGYHPLDFSTCLLRKRINFKRPDDYEGAPSHANYVTCINVDRISFVKEFRGFGYINNAYKLLR